MESTRCRDFIVLALVGGIVRYSLSHLAGYHEGFGTKAGLNL